MKALLPGLGDPSGSRRRKVAAVVTAVSAVGLVATACAAGQIAETAMETPVIDANGQHVGNLYLRGIALQPPPIYWKAGSTPILQLVIVNNGGDPDQLIGVSSPVASSADLVARSAPYLTDTPIGSVLVSNPLTGSLASSASASVSPETTVPSVAGLSPGLNQTSPGPSPSFSGGVSPYTPSNLNSLAPSGSNSQVPTPGAALSSGPSAGNALTINGHSSVSIGFRGDNPAIVLHLTKDLHSAEPFDVTFNFAKAGSVTIHTVVRLQTMEPPPSVVPSLTATE